MNLEAQSQAARIALDPVAREEFFKNFDTAEKLATLKFQWSFWGRPAQFPPKWNTQAPDGRWRNWLIVAGRGFGKAIALDTAIATRDGWTTMRDIRVGEIVFDERGEQCKVTAVHPVQIGRPCYRVVFSDGSKIVADEDHLWLTVDRRTRKALGRRTGKLSDKPQCQPRYVPRVVTTLEIASSLYDGEEVNHCIPCAQPLQCAEAGLPINPYLLGCWLGDGHSAGAEITTADREIVDAFEHAGYVMRAYSKSGAATSYGIGSVEIEDRREATTGRFIAGTVGFRADLSRLNLLGNKRVPAAYMRTSVAQRRALLQGLFDTDGYCSPMTGAAEFCSTNRSLAEDVRELALSLGYKAVISTGRATLNGVNCGEKYRVLFTAHSDYPIFRLERKLKAQPKRGAQAERAYRRYIVAVERIDSVPVRCITVDSPSRLYLAGRAMIPTHNTRTGSEWVRQNMCGDTPLTGGRWRHLALIAETAADARDVMVGDGKEESNPQAGSGLLQVHPKDFCPIYEPSKRRLTWPNGAVASVYNGTEPDQLRGPQHDAAWADELAKWQFAQEAWDQLQFGLRTGKHPQVCITTTPRPIPLLKRIMADPGTVVTRGSTFDNRANLAASFIDAIRNRYEGTRLGRQELNAEILDDAPGAYWTREMFDRPGFRPAKAPDTLTRVVVAVDPSGTRGDDDDGDSVGIVVAGKGVDGWGYVLADRTCKLGPDGWGRRAVEAYREFKADCIVAERNFGGAMVEHVIRTVDRTAHFKEVSASRGKAVRAEPVSALYAQNKVSHVGPAEQFAALEDQACLMTPDGFIGEGSPDRLDALVWALSELMLKLTGPLVLKPLRV